MIMYDEEFDEKITFIRFFEYVWGRLGYVLASSLLSRKLFRLYIDQVFFKQHKANKKRGII